MKSVTTLVVVALAISMPLGGCAVLPFAPTIAHVVPRMLFPGHESGGTRKSDDPPPDDGSSETAVVSNSSSKPSKNSSKPAAAVDSDPAQPEIQQAQLADGAIPVSLNHTDITSDPKAREVGDVLMVNVAEVINGQSTAQTALSAKRSANAALPNMFGAVESLAKHNPLLNLSSVVNSTSDTEDAGQGAMSAADTLNALVAVAVIGTSNDGRLKIAGTRSIRINGENDTLNLSGLINPRDIDSNNSISSSRVADLHLSFTGTGQIRDKQGGGMGSRMLDWLWLF
ncbi:MAG: flagellar basal body L-ring protein FlgH [Candidatus Binataceae bacterium]|jgi:flagellar L-ring protein precursor FlgH